MLNSLGRSWGRSLTVVGVFCVAQLAAWFPITQLNLGARLDTYHWHIQSFVFAWPSPEILQVKQ